MEAGTTELLETILEEAATFGAERLVIDSLTALAQGLRKPRELRVFLHSLLSRIMKGLNCTTILITEIPWGTNRLGMGIEEFVSDGIIVLEMVSRRNQLKRRLMVLKMRATELNLKYYQYEISKNIGIDLLPYPEAEE